MAKKKLEPCPCGSGKAYADCCGRYIEEDQPAPTAEALMRSRYTAYALRNASYLLATWHPQTRPATLEPDAAIKWVSLQVKRHEQIDATHALVEFVARYKVSGRLGQMQETSRFERAEGRWCYVAGE